METHRPHAGSVAVAVLVGFLNILRRPLAEVMGSAAGASPGGRRLTPARPRFKPLQVSFSKKPVPLASAGVIGQRRCEFNPANQLFIRFS